MDDLRFDPRREDFPGPTADSSPPGEALTRLTALVKSQRPYIDSYTCPDEYDLGEREILKALASVRAEIATLQQQVAQYEAGRVTLNAENQRLTQEGQAVFNEHQGRVEALEAGLRNLVERIDATSGVIGGPLEPDDRAAWLVNFWQEWEDARALLGATQENDHGRG